MKLAQKRGRLESNLSGGAGEDEEGDDGGDSDSDDESSAKARYFGYIKQGLYYVTEMERFAPPRKRPRTVIKNYRLVSLRSTTPEELYQRKVGGRHRDINVHMHMLMINLNDWNDWAEALCLWGQGLWLLSPGRALEVKAQRHPVRPDSSLLHDEGDDIKRE